jgi:hypothetical protein
MPFLPVPIPLVAAVTSALNSDRLFRKGWIA